MRDEVKRISLSSFFSFIPHPSALILKKRWALGDAHQIRRNSFEAPFARKTTPAFLASLCKTFQIIGRLQKALSRNSCCNCCHYERQAEDIFVFGCGQR